MEDGNAAGVAVMGEVQAESAPEGVAAVGDAGVGNAAEHVDGDGNQGENGNEGADGEAGQGGEEEDVDATLEQMKKKLKEWEDEAAKLQDIQEASAAEASAGQQPEQTDVDSRSIYVGNVDYGATPEELQAHFQDCGAINRVTILCNRYTGQPKGFAYIEFAEEEAVNNATILNESTFRGRQLKVMQKRTNVPGVSSTDRGRGRGRGRGRVFRGSYRAGYRGRHAPY